MSTTEIGKAMAAAFAEIDHAIKNSSNPHFKSTYANLATVLDVVRAVYGKHGLAVVQAPGRLKCEGDKYTVELSSLVMHSSGEHLSFLMDMPVATDKNGKLSPHAVGSAITFARRYALAALAGITQDDDDGNAGSSGEVDEDPAIDAVALKDSISNAKTKQEVMAFKGDVEQLGDAGVVELFKAKVKEFKK